MTTLFKDDLDRPDSDLLAEPGSGGIGMTPGETGAYEQGNFAPPDMGIGVAPPAAAPAASKPFPGVLGYVQNALYGYNDADTQREMAAQRKKKADLEEIKGLTTALEHGITMIQGTEGEERNTFVESYAKRLDGIAPGTGETFKALAKRPDLLTQFKDYVQYMPEPMQALMKSDTKKFLAFAGTAEGQKALVESKDRFDMRLATKKVQTALIGLQEYLPKEELDRIMADKIVTASDVMSIQRYLPKEVQLSETESQAIQRNDKVFWGGLGVLHGSAEQGVMAERAKRADKPNAQPAHIDVDGKRYEWDPEKKLPSARLGSDARYALLGSTKELGKGGLDKDVVQTELKLSDDYRQDTKKFAERRPLFESATDYMANRKDNKTSAGDAALMFAYAKSRDPNDRLAVSETRDLTKLGNIFERFGVSVTGILDKGETLPDRVAKEMYAEIRRSFTEQNKAQAKIEKQYTEKVKAYGGEPSRVIGEGLSIKDLEKPQHREAERRPASQNDRQRHLRQEERPVVRGAPISGTRRRQRPGCPQAARRRG
jgi:hypothetical protein